jgi:ribosome-associated translation inhibitor RaiA
MTRIDLQGFAGDQALKTYAEQRIRSWIGHFERDLELVTVCLANEGDRDGFHARCRMMARPVPWANVVVEETNVDPYAAIDRSARRLADLVASAGRGRVGRPCTGQPGTAGF